jgi:PRTRC genetic system protein B
MKLTMALSGHNRVRHGLLPHEVLSIGLSHVMWWMPPTTRTVFFDTHGENTVGKRSGKTPHPGLIFLVKDRSLSIFAVKGKTRPVASTRLYHAPYFNVWDNAKVCTGSTPLPEDAVIDTMRVWEEGFFRSNFSHTNHTKSVCYDGGAHRFWTDLLDGKFKTFPTKTLVLRRKETVGALIEQIESGNCGNDE